MSGNYSTREYREKLYDDLHVRLRDTVILMCAIFIASIGLNMNSTAVIIGAMLISPLMTPIVGLGFGLAIFDTRLIKQSLEVLFTQVLVSLLVSTLYFWISPLSYASSELIARTSPTIWDVLIAIAGGIAGFIGSRKKEANNIVPGGSHRNSSDATYLHCRLWFSSWKCTIFIWGSLSFLDQLCLYHDNQHCWNKIFDEKISLKFI